MRFLTPPNTKYCRTDWPFSHLEHVINIQFVAGSRGHVNARLGHSGTEAAFQAAPVGRSDGRIGIVAERFHRRRCWSRNQCHHRPEEKCKGARGSGQSARHDFVGKIVCRLVLPEAQQLPIRAMSTRIVPVRSCSPRQVYRVVGDASGLVRALLIIP
jgi:hypothetical protein